MSLPIKIELPKGFLDEEVRCDYLVTQKAKKIWAVELDLLNELLRVCKKHNIHIQVFAGTLLGAIRHKGFIPWDDDLDVCISRSEYEKLLKVAPSEFSEPYFFQTALTDRRYFFHYARLRNSQTTGAIPCHMSADYNNGIYIDIYVLDGYPENRFKFLFQLYLKFAVVKCLTLYYQDKPRNKSLKELLLRFPRPFVRMFSYESIVAIYTKIATMFNGSANRICEMAEFHPKGLKYWVYPSEYEETEYVPFENMLVPISKKYDAILTRIFGDYMKFPPKDELNKWRDSDICFDPDVPYREFFKKNHENL